MNGGFYHERRAPRNSAGGRDEINETLTIFSRNPNTPRIHSNAILGIAAGKNF
jgi:hypothetical protein